MPEKHLIPTIARAPAVARLLAATLLLCGGGAQAVSRTFVSGFGSDANMATNCGPTAPCRTFGAALTKTDDSGEIVVKDSAGYGPPFTISQSVSITAPDGVYAGITVPSVGFLAGIQISGNGLTVKLKGLRLTGGPVGISLTGFAGQAANTLDVQDCIIEGSSDPNSPLTGPAISVSGPTTVHVVRSVTRNVGTGIDFPATDGSSGTVSVERVTFFNVGTGVSLFASFAGSILSAKIADSVYTGGGSIGFAFSSHAGAGIAEVNVERTAISGAYYGLAAYTDTTGTAYGSITGSVVSDCATGVYAYPALASGSAVVAATGNTFIRCSEGVSNGAAHITLKNNLITQMRIDGISTQGGSIVMDGNTISENPVGIELIGTRGPTSFASTGNNVFFNNTTDLGTGVTLGAAAVH